MLLKVTIKEGVGAATCIFPAFHLNEKTRPTAFVGEMSPQMKELEKFDMITIERATHKEYRDFLVKVSERFDTRARKRREKQLRRRIETGGKETIVTGSGLLITIDPGDAKPDEIRKEAQSELQRLKTTKPPPVREDADIITSPDEAEQPESEYEEFYDLQI